MAKSGVYHIKETSEVIMILFWFQANFAGQNRIPQIIGGRDLFAHQNNPSKDIEEMFNEEVRVSVYTCIAFGSSLAHCSHQIFTFMQLPRIRSDNLIGSNRVMWHSVDCTVASNLLHYTTALARKCRPISAFGIAHSPALKVARSVRDIVTMPSDNQSNSGMQMLRF